METRTLPHTDLTVSRICFGTMTFGGQTSEEAAREMVDLCFDRGINFFDTANVYNQGESERILGRALKGLRDRVVLASKVRGKMGDAPDQQGLSRAAILRAIDESLQRLGTDYLDIYYLHMPDYETPIEETLAAMDEVVRAGKVRYPATSNYAAWQVTEILCISGQKGYRPPWISQPMYNLLARGIEQEYLPMCERFGISTFVYNPLAGGLLTGKQRRDAPISGTRFDGNKLYLDRYWHEEQFNAVDALRDIAAAAGRSMVSLALNWAMRHTPATGLILGASRMEQLKENLDALGDGPLPPDVIERCDAVWRRLRGVTPQYNR
jgi:aryl-alcohol dehydrogenase-like predicted oxidoreductase